MKNIFANFFLLMSLCCSALTSFSQTPASTNGRDLPARTIPIPATVSPEMQKQIAQPVTPLLRLMQATIPKNVEEWNSVIKLANGGSANELANLKKTFPTNIEPGTMAGVKVYLITPPQIAVENRNRMMVHLHGGAYVFQGGDTAVNEAILMAHYMKMKVVSVDYRLPPAYPFPAAVDDAVAVWKEVIKTTKAINTGLGGTSAGGGLALATVHRLKQLKLPLPGAIFGGTTWSDVANIGDTMRTNEGLDNVVPSFQGLLNTAGLLYAGKEDLKNPLISPLYGDFSGFPPTIMVSGTRDILLSDTVRVHRKMRQAGVDSQLHVFEAMSHAEYIAVFNSPESKDAWTEVAGFFSKYLGKK